MRASTFIFKRFRISSGQTSWRRKLGTIALTSAAAGSIGYLVQTNPPEKELAFLREKARLLKAGAAVCGQELGELFVNDGKEKISLESPQENASLSSENIVLKQTGRRLPDESRPGTASLGYRSGPEPLHRESTQDEIHGKVQNKYDLEPRSNAITNYLWSSEKPIEDLEAHIVKLQERRKRLCLEVRCFELLAIRKWYSLATRDGIHRAMALRKRGRILQQSRVSDSPKEGRLCHRAKQAFLRGVVGRTSRKFATTRMSLS